MEYGKEIKVDVKVITHEESYKRLDGLIYFAKDKADADKYVKEHGGIIFKEKDIEVYRVFPEVFNHYSGQVDLPMTEE